MASIIIDSGVPASHSQDARRSQRVYADVQVVNEGDADGFAELVLFGDLDGSSGVQEVRRGGGGALLKAYSNYISGGGPYRVSAVVFEIVNGQRQTVLAQHDNFTANIVVRAGSGAWMSQEAADAEAAAAARAAAAAAAAVAAEQARRDAAERERIERQNREQLERERLEREAAQRRWDAMFQAEEDYWEEPPPPDIIYDVFPEDDPGADQTVLETVLETVPDVVELVEVAGTVATVVADPWQTEETDWVAPEFTWDPWLEEG